MNMTRLKVTFSMLMKEFYRNKAVMFFVLLFPILLMVLFGFIFSDQDEVQYILPIQNMDGGSHSWNFTQTLNDTGLFEIRLVDTDLDPYDYLLQQKTNTILVIPHGYQAEMDQIIIQRFIMGQPNNDTANLTLIIDPASTAAMVKTQMLDSLVGAINKGMAGVPDVIGMDIETTVSDQFKAIDFFAPGIIAMSVMTTALFGTVGMNTELRQKGILRKLATTPLTRAEWLVTNVLYQFVMGGLSTISIIIVGMILFGLQPQINLFLPLFIILNVFAFSGIGMLITRFVKDAESAQAAANAVMFPMMFLSGTFFPLEQMPDFLQTIAGFLPLYYVNEGLRSAMINPDMGVMAFNALVIGVVGIVMFILGILLTSWKDE